MEINTESKLSFKFMILFIPVAYASYLFHEFGHWVIGEVLGNNMVYTQTSCKNCQQEQGQKMATWLSVRTPDKS